LNFFLKLLYFIFLRMNSFETLLVKILLPCTNGRYFWNTIQYNTEQCVIKKSVIPQKSSVMLTILVNAVKYSSRTIKLPHQPRWYPIWWTLQRLIEKFLLKPRKRRRQLRWNFICYLVFNYINPYNPFLDRNLCQRFRLLWLHYDLQRC
jgi:hypothetical protein